MTTLPLLKSLKAKIMPDAYAPTTLPGRITGTHYRRLAFTVFWLDAMPSTEIFYLPGHAVLMRPSDINLLEARALDLLTKKDATTRVMSVVYISYAAVEMFPSDILQAGWRVLTT